MNQTPVANMTPVSENQWEEIHRAIESIFCSFAERVCRRNPRIRAEAGRTSTQRFPLYSYYSFGWIGEDQALEDVVAGLEFIPTPNGGFTVESAICGGETGHVYFDVPVRQVSPSQSELVTAAREIAALLAEQDDIVLDALAERRPPPNYRDGLV